MRSPNLSLRDLDFRSHHVSQARHHRAANESWVSTLDSQILDLDALWTTRRQDKDSRSVSDACLPRKSLFSSCDLDLFEAQPQLISADPSSRRLLIMGVSFSASLSGRTCPYRFPFGACLWHLKPFGLKPLPKRLGPALKRPDRDKWNAPTEFWLPKGSGEASSSLTSFDHEYLARLKLHCGLADSQHGVPGCLQSFLHIWRRPSRKQASWLASHFPGTRRQLSMRWRRGGNDVQTNQVSHTQEQVTKIFRLTFRALLR